MRAGSASRSAMGSALLRAAHVCEDDPPWVFEDTLSARLLTAGEAEPLKATLAAWPPQVRAAVRVEHSVRTRLAEDLAVNGLDEGRRDYALLGAGLDTFAWRHPLADRFTVWEFDHPDTQAFKRSALTRAGLAEKPNLRFTSIDLATAPLSSLETPARATWSWLGVTMYLERTATEATLRTIASHDRGTTLVVNFNAVCCQADELTQSVRSVTSGAVDELGEPFAAAYTAEDAQALLHEAGFRTVTILDAHAVRERYFNQRLDLPHHHSALMAVAVV